MPRRTRTGAQAEPYLIVADRVRFKGNDRIWAGGKVTIDRSDFAARSDSLRLDTGKGSDGTLIGGNPTLRGLGADSFTVSGNRIDLTLDQRELTYLLAKGKGHAVSREWDLVADTIALDLNAPEAGADPGLGRQHPALGHLAGLRACKADSLALDTPGQQLKEVRGFGKALARRRPSTRPARSATGCRAIPSSPGSPRRIPRDVPGALLSQIEARHGAQSYHLEPNARFPARPRSTMPGAT